MIKKATIKKCKSYQTKFTKFELVHLRDLFGIVMPPNINVTVSQSLAELENRSHVEQMLWSKISNLCKEAGVPLEDEAPDYIVAATNTPPLGVFQVSTEPPEEDEDSHSAFLSQSSVGEE